tara:strand:+ start:316 stop:696 length:381 start_codon:yes stop_codon:yes gene_type:complete
MITVICSKTGLAFEAKSKRSKNHPLVSAILSDANKDGVYSQVKNACDIVSEQEMNEEDAIEFLNAVLKEKSSSRLDEIFEEKRKWKELWKSRKSEIFTNDEDEEDADMKSRNYKSNFTENFGGNFE